MEIFNPNIIFLSFETTPSGANDNWHSRLYSAFRNHDAKSPKFLIQFELIYKKIKFFKEHGYHGNISYNPKDPDFLFFLLYYGIIQNKGMKDTITVYRHVEGKNEKQPYEKTIVRKFGMGALFIIEYLGIPDYLEETIKEIKQYLNDYFKKYEDRIKFRGIMIGKEIRQENAES